MEPSRAIEVTCPLKSNVFADTVATTAVVFKTPAGWYNRIVRIGCTDGNIAVQFHSTVTTGVVYGQDSAWATATKVLTVSANTGWEVQEKQWVEVYVKASDLYFSVDGSDATNRWVGYATSER